MFSSIKKSQLLASPIETSKSSAFIALPIESTSERKLSYHLTHEGYQTSTVRGQSNSVFSKSNYPSGGVIDGGREQ